MPRAYNLTSESVTEGHPDKVCDQISDAVLDHIMAEDPNGRVAVETLVTTGTCIVAGEVTTTCYVPVDEVVRRTVEEIGPALEAIYTPRVRRSNFVLGPFADGIAVPLERFEAVARWMERNSAL